MKQDLYHLLVVDDDDRLRSLLQQYLSDNGFLVTSAESAAVAREKLSTNAIDMIVLDVMMPNESGIEFTKWLREKSDSHKNLPILLLTALGEPKDRVEGLEAGADDYLVKPFDPKELLLRVKKLIQRARSVKITGHDSVILFGEFSYDVSRRLLTTMEGIVHLTSSEMDLLHVLASHPGVELSREELAERIGVSFSPRTVDVQITRLRKKLEVDPKRPKFIRTVRHKGYTFIPEV